MDWPEKTNGSWLDVTNIVDLVRLTVEQQPDALAYRFLETGDCDGPLEEWTYARVDLHARNVASHLQRLGAQPGTRALLLYPPGIEFIAVFLGCIYSGVIAVPAYPHRAISQLESIARDSECHFVLTTEAFLKAGCSLTRQAPQLGTAQWIATSDILNGRNEDWRHPALTGDSLAFLQYTSGSTGQPKGVMVSHANILHNEQLIHRAFRTDSAIHVVGWLPLYHDMGLIGNVLQPLMLGASCTLFSPLAFLQRPLCWLQAISQFRGTVSGGPNFAFDLCASKLRPNEQLDLSSWKVAFNGSEPVRKKTLDRFAATFAPFGFREEAFLSCYGLAEATLFVSGSVPGSSPRSRTFAAEDLEKNLAKESPAGDPGVRALVSAGQSQLGQVVRIVDPATSFECADGAVGEIWVSGPSVAQGYWNRPLESAEIFAAHLAGDPHRLFLRTGDLGFMLEGELFVTGRLKDLIIIQGRNLYPQDIEVKAEAAHPALRPAGCAAFSADIDGEERLIVLAEIGPQHQNHTDIIKAIHCAIAEEFGVSAHSIVLLPPKSNPKTSSGKIRRYECRNNFLAGTLPALMTSSVDERMLRESAYVAPRNELEGQLACIWAQTLGVERVGIDDDFFRLGGHSLLATQVMIEISDELGWDLPLRKLFEAPTIALLAQSIMAMETTGRTKTTNSRIKRLDRPTLVSSTRSK
jgi:acyl-CoA synthetase (AMP-forming)/AMP-acid ligase II/acyl carrier protein